MLCDIVEVSGALLNYARQRKHSPIAGCKELACSKFCCVQNYAMANLRSYISSSGAKKSALADALGISRGYLSELIGGTKTPSLDVAVRIQRLTGGEVSVEDWLVGRSPNSPCSEEDVA